MGPVGAGQGLAGHHLAGVDGALQVACTDHGGRDEVVVHVLVVALPGLNEVHHGRVQVIRGLPCNRGQHSSQEAWSPSWTRGHVTTPLLQSRLLGNPGTFQLLGHVFKAALDCVWGGLPASGLWTKLQLCPRVTCSSPSHVVPWDHFSSSTALFSGQFPGRHQELLCFHLKHPNLSQPRVIFHP